MNDRQIYIRVATAHDGEKLRAMFARSSREAINRRFHIAFPEVPTWMVALMLDADRHDREAIVAVAEEKIIGHAMYARHGDEAEVALIVEDGWQSMGVGKSLLSELAQRAERRGIEAFTAEVLATNRPMMGLASMFPGTEPTMEDGVHHLRMPLKARGAHVSSPRAVRRAA